jgi:hypothetical protein
MNKLIILLLVLISCNPDEVAPLSKALKDIPMESFWVSTKFGSDKLDAQSYFNVFLDSPSKAPITDYFHYWSYSTTAQPRPDGVSMSYVRADDAINCKITGSIKKDGKFAPNKEAWPDLLEFEINVSVDRKANRITLFNLLCKGYKEYNLLETSPSSDKAVYFDDGKTVGVSVTQKINTNTKEVITIYIHIREKVQ